MRRKIVIIGGGIGGLTTAVALARRGLAAEVYEQAPELKEVGAGLGLWANALWALEPIGLAGEVVRLGERVARQGVKRPDGTWLMCYPEEAPGANGGGPDSPRSSGPTSSACWPASSTRRPSTSAPAAPASRTPPRPVTVHFADGREVKADVLIGADGVHSAVRARLLGAAPLRYRGYTGVRSRTPAGIGSAARRRDRDLGPGRTLRRRPRTPGERIIWYATWNSPAGEEPADGMRAHLRAPVRRLARPDPRRDRGDPGRRDRPQRHLRPAAQPGPGPGAGWRWSAMPSTP